MLFKRVASYSGGNSEINELMVFDIFTIIGLDDWCHNIMKETVFFFIFCPRKLLKNQTHSAGEIVIIHTNYFVFEFLPQYSTLNIFILER